MASFQTPNLPLSSNGPPKRCDDFAGFPEKPSILTAIDDWDALLPEQVSSDAFDHAQTETIIANAIATLQERQADIIRMRFGIGRDSEMTLEEIGQLYGVTRERIRQIEAKALGILSHPTRLGRLSVLLES